MLARPSAPASRRARRDARLVPSAQLEENVIVTETFFQEQLAKLSARADEVSALISNALSSGKDASTGPADFKKGPQAQAIDALVELEAETEESANSSLSDSAPTQEEEAPSKEVAEKSEL